MIVALSDDGRAYLDAFARSVELSEVFFSPTTTVADLQRRYGPDVVALAGPDASPPAGTVGFFDDGRTRTVAALLADGTRRFARMDGDVFSTNVPQLTCDPEVLTLF